MKRTEHDNDKGLLNWTTPPWKNPIWWLFSIGILMRIAAFGQPGHQRKWQVSSGNLPVWLIYVDLRGFGSVSKSIGWIWMAGMASRNHQTLRIGLDHNHWILYNHLYGTCTKKWWISMVNVGKHTIALSVWLLDHYGFAAIHRLSKIYYTKKTEKNLGLNAFVFHTCFMKYSHISIFLHL